MNEVKGILLKAFDTLQHYFLGSKKLFFPFSYSGMSYLTIFNLSDKIAL